MHRRCVSVIVPIYNGEGHIKKCIESIRNQIYNNLEIILINDGSHDFSGAICDEYAKIDKRIKVYHIQRRGVSFSRNYGLKQATGHYIQFVDSDDYLSETATEHLVSAMEQQQTDMVVCGYTRILFKKLHLRSDRLEKAGNYTNNEYLCNTLRDPGHHYYGVLWNKLYLREVIQNCQIQFMENITLGEDFTFNLRYLKSIKKVTVIKDCLYYYNCENENTLSRYKKTIDSCKRELENRKLIFDQYKKTFMDVGLYEAYKDKVQQYWLMYLIRNQYYIKYEFRDWKEEDITAWSNILYGSEEIQKCIRNISKIRRKVLFLLVYIRGGLFIMVKGALRKYYNRR